MKLCWVWFNNAWELAQDLGDGRYACFVNVVVLTANKLIAGPSIIVEKPTRAPVYLEHNATKT